MIVFPNAKINLGLKIVSRRHDGYHNIETVFLPISFRDALEIIPASGNSSSISISGMEIPGNPAQNLCLKAWELLNRDFSIDPLDFHLYKNIPPGSGLGGGSSDAAFTLRMLRDYFQLAVSDDDMEVYARQLGSDCAFFIRNYPLFAEGKGDVFSNIHFKLKKFIVLVIPPIHINTAEAYKLVIPGKNQGSLREILAGPSNTWKDRLLNDFESPLIDKFPMIAKIKQVLYSAGAEYASMSGSGSAVFGLFNEEALNLPSLPDCKVWKGQLDFGDE